MHFPTIISTLALTAAAVNAIPNSIEKRVNNVIELFDDTSFQGAAFQGSAKVGKCKNLPDTFNNLASSGKAKAGFRCTIYRNSDCEGESYTFIKDDPKFCKLSNRASSWKCVKD